MSVDTPTIVKPISPEDRAVLKRLKDRAWLNITRTYALFFLALGYVYIRMTPGSTPRDRTLWGISIFLGTVLLYFIIRDFRRRVLPLAREIRLGNKYCHTFFARKYKDPIYNKCLLYYPGRQDQYIEITPEDFEAIGNGERLRLESACITGEVLCLKSDDKVFTNATEFDFSEVPIINSLRSE